jgi:hypothetical protein
MMRQPFKQIAGKVKNKNKNIKTALYKKGYKN